MDRPGSVKVKFNMHLGTYRNQDKKKPHLCCSVSLVLLLGLTINSMHALRGRKQTRISKKQKTAKHFFLFSNSIYIPK